MNIFILFIIIHNSFSKQHTKREQQRSNNKRETAE